MPWIRLRFVAVANPRQLSLLFDHNIMRGFRFFCQRESNFDNGFFFQFMWEDQNANISRPSSARQRNAIKMAFRWHADNGQTLITGFVAL